MAEIQDFGAILEKQQNSVQCTDKFECKRKTELKLNSKTDSSIASGLGLVRYPDDGKLNMRQAEIERNRERQTGIERERDRQRKEKSFYFVCLLC